MRTCAERLPSCWRCASVRLPRRLLIAGVAIVLGILIAVVETGNWDLVLRFIHQVPYGQRDPLYGKDIGFYLFSLPAYVALKNWILLTLVLSALVAGAVYLAHGDIILDQGTAMDFVRSRSPRLRPTGSLLRGQGLVLWSGPLSPALRRQRRRGGAGYTDVHVELPASLGADRTRVRRRCRLMGQRAGADYRLPLAAAALVFGSSFALAAGVSRAVSTLLCEAERVAVGGALHPAKYRPHPRGL